MTAGLLHARAASLRRQARTVGPRAAALLLDLAAVYEAHASALAKTS